MPAKRASSRANPRSKKRSGKLATESGASPRISAVIITYNEEHRLPRCLDSLGFVDEIVVLDSHSADDTARVARSYGARFHSRVFDDFAAQKNHAVSLARGRWILSIDADEVVPPDLAAELTDAAGREQTPSSPVAYRLPRMTFYLGRWIKHGGWYPDYNRRFFIKGHGQFEGGPVHESLSVKGAVATCRGSLRHYSYSGIADHLERINRYSSLIALDKFKNGESSSVAWALGKAAVKFFITYVYRAGFLDGRPGLVIAVLASYYNFLKYIKLWELRRQSGAKI